jgi:hypothetical protein
MWRHSRKKRIWITNNLLNKPYVSIILPMTGMSAWRKYDTIVIPISSIFCICYVEDTKFDFYYFV